MKQIFSLFLLAFAFTSAKAATNLGKGPGLENSGLMQYECTIEAQQIDPETGDMGASSSIYHIVVASDEQNAKAAALNKLRFYGPFEGTLAYINDKNEQFIVQKINCH